MPPYTDMLPSDTTEHSMMIDLQVAVVISCIIETLVYQLASVTLKAFIFYETNKDSIEQLTMPTA